MNKEEKVRGICGNFGIGKSTSLLAARLEFHEIVYLNLKALIQNMNNIYLWKYELLLKEIAFSFKYILEYVISNNIESKVILDQYKELYDKDNKNIKEIIDIINKDSSNKVKLIVSSSINNNDVRSLLLKTWLPDYDKSILMIILIIFQNFIMK